jgi:hypothetical protein
VTSPVLVSTDAANQYVNGVCTDTAGNQARITAGPISVDRTAPGMSLFNLPPANNAGWYNSNVTITWQCNDAVAGTSLVSRTVSTEGANQLVSAVCTDPAGNSTSASVTVSIDKTAPVLTGGATTPAPASGWYTVPVSVAFSCTDGISGVAPGFPTGNATLSSDTNGMLVAGQCRDQAGNTAVLNVGPIRIDRTAPVPQVQSASGVNAAGWAQGPVTVTWACSDSGSGPVSPVISHLVSATGTDTVTCTDVAGNTASATSPLIRIDSTPPNVNMISPVNGFSYHLNGTVFATYLCSDAVSGISGCVGDVPSGTRLSTSALGTFTFTVTATDLAGNQTVVTRTYQVVP